MGGCWLPIILLSLQIVSCIATNVYGFTIPRFSNAISIMLLLYIGQQLNGKLKVKFDNIYLFVISVLVVYESSLLIGSIGLNHNGYKDVLQLTVGCTAALYAVCFIAKKLEKWRIGKVLELCGRESFYIMGLHIVGFKLCTMMLMSVGVINGGLENLMTPQIGNNVFLLIVYTLCGMFFPVAFMYGFRKISAYILMKIPFRRKRILQ